MTENNQRPEAAEDIRRFVDPTGYRNTLNQAKSHLIDQVNATFVDIDLLTENPHMTATERLNSIAALERRATDLNWRIEEVGRRIKKFDETQARAAGKTP